MDPLIKGPRQREGGPDGKGLEEFTGMKDTKIGEATVEVFDELDNRVGVGDVELEGARGVEGKRVEEESEGFEPVAYVHVEEVDGGHLAASGRHGGWMSAETGVDGTRR